MYNDWTILDRLDPETSNEIKVVIILNFLSAWCRQKLRVPNDKGCQETEVTICTKITDIPRQLLTVNDSY